jgi:Ctr copper transporter family
MFFSSHNSFKPPHTLSIMDHSAHGGGGSMAQAAGVWMLESDMADLPPSTSFCTGGGTVMQNGFRSSFSNGSCILWLFEGAVLDTAGKYIAALIGTFLLAFANEGIRYARARALQEKTPFKSLATMSPAAKDFVLALGYGFQMLIAYWTMLLVMLYEIPIFVAILVGLMTGYFTFNRIDGRRKLNPDSSCECSGDAAVNVDPTDISKPVHNGGNMTPVDESGLNNRPVSGTPTSSLSSTTSPPATTTAAAVSAKKSCCAPITASTPCCGGA